jgi:hypothetical protein
MMMNDSEKLGLEVAPLFDLKSYFIPRHMQNTIVSAHNIKTPFSFFLTLLLDLPSESVGENLAHFI